MALTELLADGRMSYILLTIMAENDPGGVVGMKVKISKQVIVELPDGSKHEMTIAEAQALRDGLNAVLLVEELPPVSPNSPIPYLAPKPDLWLPIVTCRAAGALEE